MSSPIDAKKVFVVIPAYNEAPVIRDVVNELLAFHYSIVVIDDGSSTHLSSLFKKMPVYFLRHKVNLGQGAALQTGIEFALSKQAEYIVTFDADGQHQAGDVEKLLQTLSGKGVDVVLGSRFMKESVHNMPASRKFLLQLARYLNFLITGLLLTDAHNGLRAMNRKAADVMQIKENRMAHATELLTRIKEKKLSWAETPVHISYTAYSRQKGQSAWNSFRVFFDILLNKIFG